MDIILILLAASIAGGFAWRHAGGGFISWPGSVFSDAVCTIIFTAIVALLAWQHPHWAHLILISCIFAACRWSHGQAQMMGRWHQLQVRDYTKWLLKLPFWQDKTVLARLQPHPAKDKKGLFIGEWGNFSQLEKTLLDFLQMMIVGAIRGSFFSVPVAILIANPGALLIVPFFAISQAMAYWLGWQTPSLMRHFNKGTEWSEFYTGLFYGLSLAVVLKVLL